MTIDPYEAFELDYVLAPLISFLVLFLLMIIMVYLYSKMRVFVPILIVFLFSVVIGIASLGTPNFPLAPYFQIFFITFQTIFLLLTARQAYKL